MNYFRVRFFVLVVFFLAPRLYAPAADLALLIAAAEQVEGKKLAAVEVDGGRLKDILAWRRKKQKETIRERRGRKRITLRVSPKSEIDDEFELSEEGRVTSGSEKEFVLKKWPNRRRGKFKPGDDRERKYACGTCGAKFFRPDHLRGHQVVHSNARSNKCSFCSKRFKRASDRNRHEKKLHPKK